MEISTFIKLNEDEQVKHLLSLELKERKDYIDLIKKKNRMLSIKLSGKVQSKMNIESKHKQDNFISIHDIKPNPNQPRKTLSSDEIEQRAESIKSRGLLQPIRIHFKNNVPYLIAGQIRLAAYKLLESIDIEEGNENSKYSKIKYELESKDEYSDFDSRIDALTENLSRNDMFILDTVFSIVDAFNEAKKIREDEFYSTRSFAKDYGLISASQLSKYIKIAQLDTEVLDFVKSKGFNKANILYQVSIMDISNEEKIKVLEDALVGKIKTVELEKKKESKQVKNEDKTFITSSVRSDITGIKKQLSLITKCDNKTDVLKITDEIKSLIVKIENEI